MDFSIVTPSFRNASWLKLCIASVADQQGVGFEHIVQDSCSDDGTLEWLPRDTRVKAFIEKDRGMYDAVNRGWRRAQGDVLAYLNCDEQYLPGVLRRVKDFLEQHPEIDVVFGDCLVVDSQGNYLCERRALTPRLWHTWTTNSLSFLTAATFLRRRALEAAQLYFQPGFLAAGDAEWALRLVRSGLRMDVLPAFVSAFAETGANLGLTSAAIAEKRVFDATTPLWVRALAPLGLVHFRWRRWRAGHYRCRPVEYAIYTNASPAQRVKFTAARPTFRWERSLRRT